MLNFHLSSLLPSFSVISSFPLHSLPLFLSFFLSRLVSVPHVSVFNRECGHLRIQRPTGVFPSYLFEGGDQKHVSRGFQSAWFLISRDFHACRGRGAVLCLLCCLLMLVLSYERSCWSCWCRRRLLTQLFLCIPRPSAQQSINTARLSFTERWLLFALIIWKHELWTMQLRHAANQPCVRRFDFSVSSKKWRKKTWYKSWWYAFRTTLFFCKLWKEFPWTCFFETLDFWIGLSRLPGGHQ